MNEKTVAGRVCIVTGGTRGLGLAMATGLARSGAKVFAPGHIAEDIPNLEESAKKLGNNDGAIHPLVADLRKPTDCEFVIDSALKKYGKVEVLINNAGLGMRPFSENFMTDPVKFWETDVNQVKATFDTNALGPFQMARAAIPHMLKGHWGRIINVTTSIGTMQRRGFFPYGPSKAALEAATQIWAEDLAGSGLTSNVLIPGRAADTDIMPTNWRKSRAHRSGAEPATPEIMVPPTLWLASDASNGFTGLRFEADKWETKMSPTEAAKQNARPVGFRLHEND